MEKVFCLFNPFSANQENVSKVVKLIKNWVMDTLNLQKDGNVFLCNDT